MTDFSWFNRRPIVVAIAGPNGAGKSTFYRANLAGAGLFFVNADDLAVEFEISFYDAARIADNLRRALLDCGESFVFETVFSDPVGEKLAFLESAERRGYEVVLCFIGLSTPEESSLRVSMRVAQGGHDVPDEKLCARFPRIFENLRRAISRLPHVLVFDNSDLGYPFRLVAVFERGALRTPHARVPAWLQTLLPLMESNDD